MLQTEKVEQGPRIVYVQYGLAFSIDGIVYLHVGLLKFPKLHDELLSHERGHSGDGRYDLDDMFCSRPGLTSWRVWKFIFYYPSALWSYSPLMLVDGRWRLDPTLLFYYMIILVCCVVLCKWFLWG